MKKDKLKFASSKWQNFLVLKLIQRSCSLQNSIYVCFTGRKTDFCNRIINEKKDNFFGGTTLFEIFVTR